MKKENENESREIRDKVAQITEAAENEREKKDKKTIVNGIVAIMVAILLVVCCFLIRQFFAGEFNSVESLQAYMKRFRAFGPGFLTVFQAAQVVVPVLPGFLGCAVGTLMFGPMIGFWTNYIGITVGSLVAYWLARKFGIDILLLMFPKKTIEKWSARINKGKSYSVFLFLAVLLPLFPDDFFCYFSGFIKMDWKKYFWIIVLGKPWCILGYSILFSYGIDAARAMLAPFGITI